MKRVACADLGNDCNTVLVAPTEERLAEMASVHLRETHGIVSISQDKIADIKKHFTSPTRPDAAYIVDRIFEKYNCDSDPECTWRYIAEAELILTGSAKTHQQELKAA